MSTSTNQLPTDEALAEQLAKGDESALRVLHRRYAPVVFTMALQSLGETEAEEIVQDTFVAVWQNRESFDATRGSFRPWLYQIVRNRIANALRHRRRERAFEERAVTEPEFSDAPAADEARWNAWRSRQVRAAVKALPPAQARALSLAFFDELSHEQVASMLGVPLGTAKTRIRGGLKRLAIALATLAAIVLLALGARRGEHWIDLRDRALRVTTSSDVQPLRMTALPGAPPAAHATYRARVGDDVAVINGSFMPVPHDGEHFIVWIRRGGQWTRLGELEPDRDGRAFLIAEDTAVIPRPDALEVTIERERSPAVPSSRALVAWSPL